MRTQTLQAPMQVVQMTGDVLVVLANGATRPLLPGEVLPAGTTLQLADDATLQLVPPDGSAPADTANAAPAGDAVPPPATTGVGAEVAAIQQALLEGVDPTLNLEATAAGGAPAAGGGGAGGSGNGGFVSIDRTGDSTLATAGFDTTYQAGATTDVLNPVAAAVVDVPAPVITPDGSSVSESNLSTSNELDTDLVNGTQAGQGSTTVQGNLNVDFGGATGSVSFLPVETQPALTSGGQPLVWTLSDDGLTLTGSVNGSVIMTVTLAADGSSYTVDLDGALDNGADPLAIAIGIQAQNDAGAITSGQIVLTVADDAPLAQDDALSVGEDDTTTVTGNVLVNDQVGADGAVVTAQTVTNELGSLVLGSDGQYSFTLNSSNPSVQALTEGETLTQVYSYTLTDADGDTSTANLTITITGSDDGIVITDLTPAGEGGEGVVFEDDLANGSDASKEALSVNGTFSVSAPDGLQSITIGGVVVTLAQLQDAAANPVALSSALGNSLTITGFSNGVVSYTYTLLGNEAHPEAGNDVVLDNTTILVTDRDGDTASSNLSIQIVDDVPTAVADSASIAEDAELLTIEGNVLTSDTQGADGAVVTPQTVESELGTLELESNGEYSFTLNNSNPSVQALAEGETLTQVYSYTLTDADGDTSTANLTITITGSDDGIVITDLTPAGEGGEGVVFEDDLANGSDASKEPLSVEGTFSVSAPDGLQSITIGGVVVTLAQLQDAAANPVALSSALGNSLTITGFSDGVVSYTYTLLDNETHPEAGNDVLLDNTTILVTDRDGDTASSNLSIQIVDDVPEISIAATPNTVVEGESLTTGTWSLNAGADGAAVAVIVGGVSYALGEEIDTGKGILTVLDDGSWSFAAADNLDNDSLQQVSFTLKATDGDQDVDEATQTITITDGNEPEWGGEVNSADLTVDEAALSVLGGDTGTDPTSDAETDSSGTLQFKAGSDAIDSIVFGDPSDISIAGIDTDNMVWTLSLDGRTLTGAVGSEDVLKLTLEGASSVAVDGTGNVTVKAELLGNLLHQDDPNAGSLVVSGITVVGADDDGDSLTANVSVTVNDDAPDISIAATPNTVVEGESLTTGTWSLNAGADGAAVAVIVGGVSYALGEEIDTGKGILTVLDDGSWSFAAADNLDNDSLQQVSFTLKATDGDQDVDEATQTITITDGSGPEWGGEVNSAHLTVDEAALSVLGGDTGTDPTSDAETDSSGTLQFKAGSDAIDSIVFGNPSGISIAGIDTNNMVWTLSPDGRTLTGAVGSEDVLKLTLEGATGVAVDGTGNVTVKAELLGNLLHQDEPNAGSLVVSGITVVGADDDGDSLTANVSVTVNDDAPDIGIAATPNTVVEGESLTTGTWSLNAGADGAAVAVIVGGVSYALGEEIDTGKGTLTVHTDGSWSFAAADNLDNDTLQQVSFTLKATDGDQDVDEATQTITITDGSGPEWGGEVNSAHLTMDEAALSVLGGDTGTDPTSDAETDSSGTLQFKAGSDAIDSIVFGDPSGISIAGIDTNNIVWTLSPDGRTLTGAVGSADVLKLTLEGATGVAVDGTGNVTVKAELLGNLLHQDDPNAGSLVVSGITVVGADDDGDSLTANVSVTVNDDAPILTSVESAALLNSDAGFASGSSVLNLGADQPAIGDLTGNIPGWDGTTVTYAQSSLTSNEKPVYFFVDPNNPETLFAYTSETAGAYDPDSLTQSLIFTLDYQESGDYALTMDGKLDAPTQEFGASFSTTIGGNQDYLVVTNTGGIYKPGATIPDGQTVVMMIDSAPGVTVNSSQQGLGADGQWIEGDAVINFNFTTPVVSAEFKIDIQSVNEGADTTNDVDWVVHGTDADGNLVTETGTTAFTDGVMTQIPTTLTHITKVELSDHSGLEGNSFRVSGYEVVDRIDEEPFDKSFVVGVTDADGDTANGQLTVTFNPDGDTQLLVGSNANDVAGSSARFITTADAGAIVTGSGDDILVGDEGRSSLVGKSVNLILMLDTSGSMDSKISFDGGHNNTTRLEAMQDAVNNLLANLAGGAAEHVRVHIIDFDSTATSLGSFDVKDGELTAAEKAVDHLKQGGMTNYEAALQAALNWLGSSGSDAPLTGANVINQAIFISDGQPNSWLTGNSSNLASYTDGSKSEALRQMLGLSSGSDNVNEVALLEQLFAQIQAIGINVSANDLDILNQVEGEPANVNPDAATNITTAQQLDDVLANLDPSLVLRDAGNDELSGGGGNDLLFGDAPFTDTLAHDAGLALAAGAGWQVFSELEAGQSTVDGYEHWTRADTVAYIQDHAEELAQESGRNLGNDILDGGAGNDYLFGQEGDDQLDGGVGNDQLYGGSGSDEMTGGNGNDVFVWLKGDADKSTDTITDFTIGHDKLDLADVLNDPTGNLSDYLSVTGSGDDALVKVYSAGNASGGGTADLTIVLDGLASTSTELQQLQDYLLNQDGVIK